VVPARKRHLAQRQCLPCHGTKFSTVPATEGNSVSIIEYRDDYVQVLHIELVTYQQVQIFQGSSHSDVSKLGVLP